jgi:hypothetical protein
MLPLLDMSNAWAIWKAHSIFEQTKIPPHRGVSIISNKGDVLAESRLKETYPNTRRAQ